MSFVSVNSKYPHLPRYQMPMNYRKVSSDESIPPGYYAYWIMKGQTQKLVCKEFDYDQRLDKSFKIDESGYAETKTLWNGIEITPEDAIRMMQVWKTMLKEAGWTVDL